MTISQLTPANPKSTWPFSVLKLMREEDLQWYLDQYLKCLVEHDATSDVKIEYLRHSDIYLVFILGKVSGGFGINAYDLRYMVPFQQKERDELETKTGIDFNNTTEITLIWHKIPKEQAILRQIFFASSIHYALKKGTRYIMGGASNLHTFATYKLVLTKDLFRGVLKNGDGREFQSFLCFNSRFGTIISALKCIFTRNTRPKKAIID